MSVTKENIQEVFGDLSWDEQENHKTLLPTKSMKDFNDNSRKWEHGDVLMDGNGSYFMIEK